MATNPMQRRARNSFLAGMLVTLILAVLVVAFLFYQIMNLKSDITNLKKVQTQAYVLTQDIESGTAVTSDMFVTKTVITSVPASDIVSPAFFISDNDTEKEYVAKINLPAGTIVTENMLIEKGNEVTNDMRLMEYNMILLPTQLVEGNFVDIRLSLPGGQSYIVVSKKYVEKANLDTIWMKMSEEEILTLGNAIVESYIIEGSKLEAVTYLEAGTQDAATVTYAVSEEVRAAIARNPNIKEERTFEHKALKATQWDSYGGLTPTDEAIKYATDMLNKITDATSSIRTAGNAEYTRSVTASFCV